TVAASGAGARAVLQQLKELVLGIHEAPHASEGAHAAAPSVGSAPKGSAAGANDRGDAPAATNRLRGVIASRGLAVGRAVTLKATEIAVVEAGRGIAHESAEFERARDEVR